MALGFAYLSISAKRLHFNSVTSGAFSWIKSALATAFFKSASKARFSRDEVSARPDFRRVGQVCSIVSLKRFSAPSAGSDATTFKPWARQRRIQPLPITPVPTQVIFLILLSLCLIVSPPYEVTMIAWLC